jgi:hypothetical protein
MPAKTKYVVKKYDGDDIYSWAVFKAEDVKGLGNQIFYGDAKPIVCGESKSSATATRDRLNSK